MRVQGRPCEGLPCTRSKGSVSERLGEGDEFIRDPPRSTGQIGESSGDAQLGHHLILIPGQDLAPRRANPTHLCHPGENGQLVPKLRCSLEAGLDLDNDNLGPLLFHHIHPPTHVSEILNPGGFEVREVVGVVDVVVGVKFVEANLERCGVNVSVSRKVEQQSLSSKRFGTNATLATMQAWQLTETTGIDAYVLNDVPEPEPGPGQVRVAIKISGLNHLDLWVSRGLPAPKQLPHTGGSDAAGVVDAIGEGVAGFEIGDEVVIDPSFSCGECAYCRNDEIVYCSQFAILGEHRPGTLTEKIVIPTINAVRKPSAVDWDVAGSFGLASVTALRMLEKARLKRGETVLVVGVGGGVSAAAMYLSQAFGAEVYVTSRSQEKLDWAVNEGAVAGFDSSTEFGKEMAALGGADLVIDNVGPATLKQSMRAAKAGGRVAICGSTSGAKFELTVPLLFFRQLELIGSSMGNHAQFARALNWIRIGKAKSPVSRVFPFDELPEALRYLDSGDQVGKVVIGRGA